MIREFAIPLALARLAGWGNSVGLFYSPPVHGTHMSGRCISGCSRAVLL
jgi:hypothetical protein